MPSPPSHHHSLRPSHFGGGTPPHPSLSVNRCNSLRSTLPPNTTLDPQSASLYLLLSPSFDHLLSDPSSSSPSPSSSSSSPCSTDLPTLLFSPTSLLPHLQPPHPPSYLLGLYPASQIPIHALILPPSSIPLPQVPNTHFKPLRALAHLVPPLDLNLAAHARSLAEFHLRHRFCGLCAAPTLPDHHGARRRCSRNIDAEEPHHITPISLADKKQISCPGVWFPRIDPVAIMLVVCPDGDRCLLARQPRFPKALYSCLAGFMEHAEGVDDAVRREVWEEVGITVSTVRFFGSQPWPFPYSLMLACVARAESVQIKLDEHELEHADWFTREHVKQMVGGTKDDGLVVPPMSAIGGELCAAFARGDEITLFDDAEIGGRL